MQFSRLSSAAVIAGLGLLLVSPAHAQFTETEANETKATANTFSGLANGATITGNSTGSSTTTAGTTSADTFRVSTAAAAPGIYRNRLTLTTTGTAGHTGSIRGLSQSTGVISTTSDATFQSSTATTTPARFNQWYGFGKSEELYYRVAGTTTTTANYVATLETTAIVPTDLGSITRNAVSSSFVISSAGQTGVDTDVLLYDANFNPIDLNDDILGVGVGQSTITRSLGYGTYYVAISDYNTANNQASPATDNFRGANVLDFPNIVANSSTSTNQDVDFTIVNGASTLTTGGTALKVGAFDVNFYRFSVVPAPSSVAVMAMGGLLPAFALLRRRKK